VITTATDVGAGVNLGAALTNDDVTSENLLTTVTFYTKTF